MESKELRIGNFVKVNGKIIEIESIDDEGVNCEVSGGYYSGESEKDYEGYFKNIWFLSSGGIIEPIELESDILIKSGFFVDNTKAHIVYNEVGNIYQLNIVNGSFQSTYLATEIKYIHELQNHYFFNIKSELKINL